MKIELPPKYYLDHFKEMLRALRSSHLHLLQDEHRELLRTFDRLSEDGQCLFIRMANRKGSLFDKASFEFQCWDELKEHGLIRDVTIEDEAQFLTWAKKTHLQAVLTKSGVAFGKSASKPKLLELYLQHREQLTGVTDELTPLVIFAPQRVLDYILFVFFGKVQESLVLYTLRDLGVRKSAAAKVVKPKFESLAEAHSVYYYSTLEKYPEAWPAAIGDEALQLQREWKYAFAEEFRQSGEFDLALRLYQESGLRSANERRARLLHELGRIDECREFLQQLIDGPLDAEELFFAEDFMARKFEKKRVSRLTEMLRSAGKLTVDEGYFRHPEMGVIAHFTEQGQQAFFTENYLWAALTVIVFHEQLKGLQVHSEFDWRPQDLKGKLQFDEAVALDWEHLLAQDLGDSPLMKFGDHGRELVRTFVTHVPVASLRAMLKYLSESYDERSSGFPDLMVIQDGTVKFIEVKAEGDSLKNSQLRQIVQLERAGIACEVLNVTYRYNPEQTYVVVDIETTGLMTPYNRITEVAAVKVKGGEIIDRFQTLLNPRRPIPRDIQKLTGITNEMVASAPGFEEIAGELETFTQGSIFVAHNVGFDYGFIQREFARLEQTFVRPYICTKAGMKKHYPGLPSYGLKNLSAQFEISLEQHHRALSDALAAAGLLNLINLKRAGESRIDA